MVRDRMRKILAISLFLFFCMVSSGFSFWCYQETPNVATFCGGLSTGNFSGSTYTDYQVNDGEWGTSSSQTAMLNITYSKPSGANSSSLWKVGDGNSPELNLTIPQQCWDAFPGTINLWEVANTSNPGSLVYWGCNNATGSTILNTSSTLVVYEEAMWWQIQSPILSVVSDYPADNVVNQSARMIEFGWTPNLSAGEVKNCSLFTNVSGTWGFTKSNTSQILKNVSNNITYNFINGNYTWAISCYSPDEIQNFSLNRTIKVNVPDENVINMTLVSPVTNTSNTSKTIEFKVNATFFQAFPANISLWTNESGTWARVQTGTNILPNWDFSQSQNSSYSPPWSLFSYCGFFCFLSTDYYHFIDNGNGSWYAYVNYSGAYSTNYFITGADTNGSTPGGVAYVHPTYLEIGSYTFTMDINASENCITYSSDPSFNLGIWRDGDIPGPQGQSVTVPACLSFQHYVWNFSVDTSIGYNVGLALHPGSNGANSYWIHPIIHNFRLYKNPVNNSYYTINHTFSTNGDFVWGMEAMDVNGNQVFSENRTILLEQINATAINIIFPSSVIQNSENRVKANITDLNSSLSVTFGTMSINLTKADGAVITENMTYNASEGLWLSNNHIFDVQGIWTISLKYYGGDLYENASNSTTINVQPAVYTTQSGTSETPPTTQTITPETIIPEITQMPFAQELSFGTISAWFTPINTLVLIIFAVIVFALIFIVNRYK